jgi:peptidoglycan/xylan/chitin deacetylase (PgdA/CDA1 family)
VKTTLKRIALVLLAFLGYGLGLPLWKRLRRSDGFRVLRYHSISRDRSHETNVSPDAFREQMLWLKQHYHVLDPDDLYARKDRPPVLVTFDDGYADNVHQALPILEEAGIKAVVFLIAGYVGTDKLLPHDAGQSLNAHRLLRWEEAKNSDARTIEFGSHGWSHRRLGQVGTAEELKRELVLSKQVIEEKIDRPVRFLSFPFGVHGDYDATVKAMGKEAGYSMAFNAKYGENTRGTDPFDLFRIGVEGSDTMFTFRAKLNGALDLLRLAETPWGRGLVRGLNHLVRV